MATIHVTPGGFSAAFRRKLRRDLRRIRAAATEAANRGLAAAVRITDAEDLVDQGAYKRGFAVRRLPDGAELRNDAPHASVIEWGRRPRRPGPPLEPIREWVARKLGLSGPELERAAWAVRRAIHERGGPPRAVMRRVAGPMRGWFREEVLRRMTR